MRMIVDNKNTIRVESLVVSNQRPVNGHGLQQFSFMVLSVPSFGAEDH